MCWQHGIILGFHIKNLGQTLTIHQRSPFRCWTLESRPTPSILPPLENPSDLWSGTAAFKNGGTLHWKIIDTREQLYGSFSCWQKNKQKKLLICWIPQLGRKILLSPSNHQWSLCAARREGDRFRGKWFPFFRRLGTGTPCQQEAWWEMSGSSLLASG